jgi:hypothetical protein
MILLLALPASASADSGTLLVNYVDVRGDERKFRQDQWTTDGWSGGVERSEFERDLGQDTVLRGEGRAVFGEEDYRLRLELIRYGVGFVRAGYTQNRTHYDDWGGFYRPFRPPAFRLERDLRLDDGDLFVEAGVTLPDRPRLTLGYQRQSRDGTKSLLQWGGVQQDATERNIFPSLKDIRETVHIFKLGLDHHVGIVNVGNQFRYERYRDDNTTFDTATTNLTSGASQTTRIHETSHYDLLANVFHMDSRVNDRAYWSAAYLYSRMDGNAGLKLDTTPFATVAPTFDAVNNWFTRSVDLDQHSHVVTVNGLLGPFKQFSFYGGAQAEKTRGSGNGDAELLQILGGFTNAPLALLRSDNDKQSLEQTLGARFSGLPYTTLYAEGRWREEQYSRSESETDDGVANLRLNTTTDAFRQQYTVGFNSAPWRKLTLAAHYRWSRQHNDYQPDADASAGYPGFLTEQDLTAEQIVARLTLRPQRKLALAFQYKLVSTDIRTSHRSIVFSGNPLVPAGATVSGESDADTYTFTATVTPLARLYLSGGFTWLDTRTTAFANHAASVPTYHGDVYTVFGASGFALDDKTDLTLDYAFSRADNPSGNAAAGLPLGVNEQRQSLTASLARRISKNVLARVRYGFFEYDNRSGGGINNYRAQFVAVSCAVGW